MNNRTGCPQPAHTQHGMAILEALVAMLVFALGILGLVGLQAGVVRDQTSARFRNDAAELANEITGTMWGDITHLASYAASGSTGNCAGYTRCNDWLNKVAADLPKGLATITVATTTGDVSVAIQWTMPNGESHQFILATTIVAADAS